MSDQESWDDIAAPMVASSDEEGSLGSVGAASPIFSESEGSHASWLEVQAAPLEDQAPVGDAVMAIATDVDNISSIRKEDLKRRRGRPSKADRLVDALVSTDPAPPPVSAPCKNLSAPCKPREGGRGRVIAQAQLHLNPPRRVVHNFKCRSTAPEKLR